MTVTTTLGNAVAAAQHFKLVNTPTDIKLQFAKDGSVYFADVFKKLTAASRSQIALTDKQQEIVNLKNSLFCNIGLTLVR